MWGWEYVQVNDEQRDRGQRSPNSRSWSHSLWVRDMNHLRWMPGTWFWSSGGAASPGKHWAVPLALNLIILLLSMGIGQEQTTRGHIPFHRTCQLSELLTSKWRLMRPSPSVLERFVTWFDLVQVLYRRQLLWALVQWPFVYRRLCFTAMLSDLCLYHHSPSIAFSEPGGHLQMWHRCSPVESHMLLFNGFILASEWAYK